MSAKATLVRAVVVAAVLTICANFCAAEIPQAAAKTGPNSRMPALREGLVFTSKWFAMSHAGHATDFKQDDNGNWLAADGTRLLGSDRPSTSAGGISQAVVTCIDGDKVFLAMHNYTDMRVLGLPDPVPNGPAATFAVGIGGNDFWQAPADLAQLHSDPATHTVVQPVQWKVDGQTCAAIRVTQVRPDQYIDHVFDSATGICLHGAESSTSAAPQLKYIAPGENAAGDTLMSSFDLLSLRDVNTPWANEPLPAWVGQFQNLHYAGASQASNRMLQPVPTQLGLDVTRLDSGNGWLSTTAATYAFVRGQPTPPSKKIYISGRDQFDGFFAGPIALAKLQAGQILDSDPITHVQVSVQNVNGNSVTLLSENRSGQVTRTFDLQTGRLSAFTTFSAMTKIRASFQLQGG